VQLSHLMILREKKSKELRVVLFGCGHDFGLGEDCSLSQGQPERDDVAFFTFEANQPVEVTSVVWQHLMFDLADEGTGVPLCYPRSQRVIETSRGVLVGERRAFH